MNPLTGILLLLGIIGLVQKGKGPGVVGEGESPTGLQPADWTPGSGLPRGIRNNNPGNIKRSATPWRGKIPQSNETDPIFEEFVDKPHGTRAMIKVLQTYQSRYGLNTIRKILGRYAPNSENPTSTYVSYVAKHAAMGVDIPFNTKSVTDMRPVIKAMAQFENGRGKQWVTDSDFNRGWLLV